MLSLAHCPLLSPQTRSELLANVRNVDAYDFHQAEFCPKCLIEVDVRKADCCGLRMKRVKLRCLQFTGHGSGPKIPYTTDDEDFTRVTELLNRQRGDQPQGPNGAQAASGEDENASNCVTIGNKVDWGNLEAEEYEAPFRKRLKGELSESEYQTCWTLRMVPLPSATELREWSEISKVIDKQNARDVALVQTAKDVLNLSNVDLTCLKSVHEAWLSALPVVTSIQSRSEDCTARGLSREEFYPTEVEFRDRSARLARIFRVALSIYPELENEFEDLDALYEEQELRTSRLRWAQGFLTLCLKTSKFSEEEILRRFLVDSNFHDIEPVEDEEEDIEGDSAGLVDEGDEKERFKITRANQ